MEENNISIEHTENVQPQIEAPNEAAEAAEKEVLRSDLTGMTREELVKYFKKVQEDYVLTEVAKHLEDVKSSFDALTKAANDELHQKFIDEGGEEKDFKPVPDPLDQKMKELYSKYRETRKSEKEAADKERKQNALEKRNIIQNMNNILAQPDNGEQNKTFKDLMAQWKKIGQVPQNEKAEIDSAYRTCVDKFYDNMRISRDLRELDMKRNYDEKVKLCEQAEKLVDQPSAPKAFFAIQQIHASWKNIGPVSAEQREALWNRLKAATNVINERFHKYVDENHEKEKQNYEAKLALCKEVEELGKSPMETIKECDAVVNKMLEIQTRWRSIGFAPKEFNNSVYADFRKLCDVIYEKKRKTYKDFNASLSVNYDEKVKLCEKAEELADSTDWRKTTDALINLQKQWKKIGPVPHKRSEAIWTRFRAACDKFFNNKAQHFEGVDGEQNENLEKKRAIIEELKAYQMPEDVDEHFKVLQSFQQRWNQIGFVAKKVKNDINQEFASLINQQYDKLNTDDNNRNLQRFKSRMELMLDEQNGRDKITHERNKLITKLKQLEQDIVQLENNIGFFTTKSKQTDRLVNDVNEKIKNARANIDMINLKLDIIDALVG